MVVIFKITAMILLSTHILIFQQEILKDAFQLISKITQMRIRCCLHFCYYFKIFILTILYLAFDYILNSIEMARINASIANFI